VTGTVEAKEILDAFERVFEKEIQKPVHGATKYPEAKGVSNTEKQSILRWLEAALKSPTDAEEELRRILGGSSC
jgi:hypothetical protein